MSVGSAAAGADTSKLVAHGFLRLRDPHPPMGLREDLFWCSLAGSAAFFRAVAEAVGQALACVFERFVVELSLPQLLKRPAEGCTCGWLRGQRVRMKAGQKEIENENE